MLVHDFLENSAGSSPDKTALISGKDRFSYADVERKSNALAHALLRLGLKRHDRVAIQLENSPESVISIFGALKAGGIFVVVNPRVKTEKLRYILQDCQARVLITAGHDPRPDHEVEPEPVGPGPEIVVSTGEDEERVRTIPWKPAKTAGFDELIQQGADSPPGRETIDADPAGLIYTSGSGGFPKGVMATHFNIVSASRSIIEYLENGPEDVVINALPLSFDYGLYQVFMTFRFGGSLILERSFLYVYPIIRRILDDNVTGFPIVPPMAALIFRFKGLEKRDFSGLRYITSTGQTLSPRAITGLRRIFPRTRLYSMYGLTECKRVSFLPPEELDERPASVGRAMPNTEAFIVDDKGNRIGRPDVVGELVVRGSHVTRGYWNKPEETDRVFRPGPFPGEKVLHTGDLFRMDRDGFLYFVSRKDDMLNIGGQNVSPREIENCISRLDGVRDVAVVGVPDEILGTAPGAYVVLDEGSGLSDEEILRFCARNLEAMLIPKRLEIREALPLSPHGKIDKQGLS